MIGVHERCHVDRKPLRGLRPVAQLIRDHMFRLHLRVAEQNYFARPGQRRKNSVQSHITPRMRAAGARYARPEGTARARSPGLADARLELEAVGTSVLAICVYIQVCATWTQSDLI